jgi:hypothetical protein
MNKEAGHHIPSLGHRFRWGVVIAGALYVLVHYGLSGLFSVTLLAGLALLSVRRGSGEDDASRKRLANAFNEQKFGPTTEDLYYDPLFHRFQGNWFHKRYHDKD